MAQSKKPTRYPRKLRVTLEKVKAHRQADTEALEEDASIGRSFWSSFIRPKSVWMMTATVSMVLRRFETKYHLEAQPLAERVTVPPPWERT